MNFYALHQNNSGGVFRRDKEVDEFVIIEAPDAYSANYKASELGIYFDGVSEGRDCECCGDRWYAVDEYNADKTPKIYGRHPMNDLYPCIIYYFDGHKEEYNRET